MTRLNEIAWDEHLNDINGEIGSRDFGPLTVSGRIIAGMVLELNQTGLTGVQSMALTRESAEWVRDLCECFLQETEKAGDRSG